MTALARKRELCVKVIRSHLISCPGGLTVQQLERDYEETERKQLPFRMFGFSDALSFLESLSDVVRLDYRGSQIRLHGIADESSKHVKELIDHQKRKRNAKGPPRISSNVTIRRPTTRGSLHTKFSPVVPNAYLQDFILRVVRKLKASMSLTLFCDLYEKEIGLPLDGVRHGFRSTPHLLQSLPHICRLEFGRKDCTGNDLYVYPVHHNQNLDVKKKLTHPNSTPKLTRCPPDTGNTESLPNTPHSVTGVAIDVSTKHKTMAENIPVGSGQTTSNKILRPLMTVNVNESKGELESEILQLLKEHPGGVKASNIPPLYEKKFKKLLDIKKWGYYSVIEFISKINGEIIISRPQKTSDWMISLKTDKSVSSKGGGYTDEEELQLLKMEIREILLRVGKEIPVEKLPEIYERTYHHSMNLDVDDKNAVMNMIFTIDDAVIRNDCSKLLVTVGAAGLRSKLPPDTVGPNYSYRLPTLPTVEDQYIDVFVADVTDPSHFSIQIYGPRTTGALNELMDKLERFYCNLDDGEYDLPINMIQPGQICATIYMEDLNWHRAVIVGVYDGDFADVLYVDYGTIATVPVTALKLLKACFLTLPMQMIKARLSHIKPHNLKSWTLEARNSMIQMCRNKQLVALVSDVQGDVLSLCLCDTNDLEVDIHVNDVLVDQRHAVVFPDMLDDAQNHRLIEFYKRKFDDEKSGAVIDLYDGVLEFLQDCTGRTSTDIIPENEKNVTAPQEVPREEMLPYLDMTLCSNVVNQTVKTNTNSAISNAPVNTVTKSGAVVEAGAASKECPPLKGDVNAKIDITVASIDTKNNNVLSSTYRKEPRSCGVVSSANSIPASKMLRYVQKHYLVNGKYTLHVINYEGNPMVTSYEISLWFGQTADFLRPMLCMKRLSFEELVIGRNEKHRDLFNSVEKFDVPKEQDVLTDVLCLYRLQDVPPIISGLGHIDHYQMVQDVLRILRAFDSSSKYWFSEMNKVGEDIEDLHLRRKNLVEERILLLEKLAEKSSPDTVDQIMAVENTIEQLMAKIQTTRPKIIKEEDQEPKRLSLFSKTTGPKTYKPNNPFLNNSRRSEDITVPMHSTDNSSFVVPDCKLSKPDACPPLVDISKCGLKAAEVPPHQKENKTLANKEDLMQDVTIMPPHSVNSNITHQSDTSMSVFQTETGATGQQHQRVDEDLFSMIPGPRSRTDAVVFEPQQQHMAGNLTQVTTTNQIAAKQQQNLLQTTMASIYPDTRLDIRAPPFSARNNFIQHQPRGSQNLVSFQQVACPTPNVRAVTGPFQQPHLVAIPPISSENSVQRVLNTGTSGSMIGGQNRTNPMCSLPAPASTVINFQSSAPCSMTTRFTPTIASSGVPNTNQPITQLSNPRPIISSVHSPNNKVQITNFMPQSQMQPISFMPVSHSGGPTLYSDAQGRLFIGQLPANSVLNQGALPLSIPISPRPVFAPGMNYNG